MKVKLPLFVLIFYCFSLLGTVENSILPQMDQLVIRDLSGKLNEAQMKECEALDKPRLRVMSFNMLFNHAETEIKLDWNDQWVNRKSRMDEYVRWAHPDVIGSQELQPDQIEYLLSKVGDDYACCGKEAVFYRKERLELIESTPLYLSEDKPSTLCVFRDKQTNQQWRVINTHLAFGNIEKRYVEACALKTYLLEHPALPTIVTGDFNTFSFRQELDLPFYDGDTIVQLIEQGGVTDSPKRAIFGHFGPISSTNFCSKTRKAFCSEGEPGIVLDHIFVSKEIQVLAHGIDPARVDGHFPSDHFPVIVDLV